jgi:hypothetical protein
MVAAMKLQQGQVWKQGDHYLRIVHLGRLEVEYKAVHDLASREGIRRHVSKKEFCRLLKHANQLTPAEIQTTRSQ